MTMKNYTKIEQELTGRFKIDIRNFTNFHPSTQKSPEHFLTNFGGWSHSFALSNWDWKNKNIYLKINIFILTFSLTRHPLGYSDQCCHYTETSPLIYRANQWDGVCKMAKLGWNKLNNVKHHLFFIYFLLSWRKSSPLFLSVQPNHLFYTKT